MMLQEFCFYFELLPLCFIFFLFTSVNLVGDVMVNVLVLSGVDRV